MRSARPSTRTARRAASAATALAGAAASLAMTTGPASAAAPATSENFVKLKNCESGGDYTTNTGNGYYGAYQFDVATWQGLGYPGRPDQHSPSTQNAAARQLQSERGWQPWPACSRSQGLR